MALISQAELARELEIHRSSVMRRMDYRGGTIPTYEVEGERLVNREEALRLWSATKRGQGGQVGANPTPPPIVEPTTDEPVAEKPKRGRPSLSSLSSEAGLRAAELRLDLLETKATSDRIALEIQQGSLVDKATAIRQAFSFTKKFRDALINLPARIGPVLAAETGTDGAILTASLERHVRQFLTEIADQPPDIG